jgi:hypothetical protein
MRPVSERAIRITSRIVFLLCGLVSLLTGVPYVLLRGAELPVESEWIVFVIALALVGGFSVVVAVLPLSWIARVRHMDCDDQRLFTVPLKLLSACAAISYLVAVGAYSAPRRWNLDPQFMLALCPLYFVKMAFDPSPRAIFLLLAPMNAAVYGSLAVTLACAWSTLRRRG